MNYILKLSGSTKIADELYEFHVVPDFPEHFRYEEHKEYIIEILEYLDNINSWEDWEDLNWREQWSILDEYMIKVIKNKIPKPTFWEKFMTNEFGQSVSELLMISKSDPDDIQNMNSIVRDIFCVKGSITY